MAVGARAMYRVWNYVTQYSLLLVIGAVFALFWAGLDPLSYRQFAAWPLWFGDTLGTDIAQWQQAFGPGHAEFQLGDVRRVVTVQYIVNDMLMAAFFAIAAKEVWEAVILRNGSLR